MLSALLGLILAFLFLLNFKNFKNRFNDWLFLGLFLEHFWELYIIKLLFFFGFDFVLDSKLRIFEIIFLSFDLLLLTGLLIDSIKLFWTFLGRLL